MLFEVNDRLHLDVESKAFVVRKKDPRSGPTVGRTVDFPQPFSALIGRVIHQSWMVNCFSSRNSDAWVELTAAHGRKFVKISLLDGESVSFKIKCIVFWSENIKIKTKINFSAVHFSTRMNFVQVATGPGVIVLEVSGEPRVVDSGDCLIPASRLISWSSGARFEVCPSASTLDLYFNLPQLKLLSKGVCLIDNDDASTRSPVGIWHYIKSFYTHS